MKRGDNTNIDENKEEIFDIGFGHDMPNILHTTPNRHALCRLLFDVLRGIHTNGFGEEEENEISNETGH